ncbi:hypothetical protein DQP55_12355 [Mycolicibacterium sp. GF69]|uniref:hypothetical protein n=1 Tax=Mycolicibacterium sp. GF69 TaxID=2267251 RepID=UPI000DCB42BB|nr:hypothetical protein [Mycolicibacterium sp. GF69]RAV12408.1 hypothetical protein DQP55_12355 [Mycolicibacterium sp. GF69]
MTIRGSERPPVPSAPQAGSVQVIVVHDLQEGDYLPDYGGTVKSIEIRTERLGVEWVDLLLSDQRQLTLDGHDDIAAVSTAVQPALSRRR